MKRYLVILTVLILILTFACSKKKEEGRVWNKYIARKEFPFAKQLLNHLPSVKTFFTMQLLMEWKKPLSRQWFQM
jgi:hypothetical protein